MTREEIHALLDDALDRTEEGEHFLPEFVSQVLKLIIGETNEQSHPYRRQNLGLFE